MSLTRCCAVALLVLSSTLLQAATPKQMSVVIKTAQVRSTPSFLGKPVGTLAYGDRVDVLEVQKDWARIRFAPKALAGWLPLSSLIEKKITLSSGSGNVDQSASSGEVALAGKGFNEQIENEYRQEGEVDYSWVDKMEQINVPLDELSAFVAAGGLNEGGSK